MENLKVGIVIADIEEYKPFAAYIEKGENEAFIFLKRQAHKFYVENNGKKAEVVAIHCGVGKVNAATCAMHLIDIGCNVILNYGLSGGISNINRGEITAPNSFVEHDFDMTAIGYKFCEKPIQKYVYGADEKLIETAKKVIKNLKIGTAVSGDHFICNADERNLLRDRFDAMSCDMETAAIAYVCDFAEIPYLSIRRVSDDAGENASDTYREMNNQDDTLLSDYIIDIIKEIL